MIAARLCKGLCYIELQDMTHGDSSDRRSKSRAASFGYAFSGIWRLLRTQPNARIHTIATICVVALSAWLGVSRVEWAILALTIGLVWTAEFINTALEAVVDLASPNLHPLAKIGKDVSAAAVLVAAITSVVVGLLILGPPLWTKLFGG
jgi:diacylglycerol kinase